MILSVILKIIFSVNYWKKQKTKNKKQKTKQNRDILINSLFLLKVGTNTLKDFSPNLEISKEV